MKIHSYRIAKRIVALLLTLILILDVSCAGILAAGSPQKPSDEKESALSWLTQMFGSREEAELFYARMDALGLLDGEPEPGASKLTIAGKDYTLEEAKAILDSFSDEEPVTIDRSVITVGDLKKMIEVDEELRQTMETYESLSPEQKDSYESFMQALEAGNVRFDASTLTTGPSGINHAVRVVAGVPTVTDTPGIGAEITVPLTLDGTPSESQTVTLEYEAVSGTAIVADTAEAPASGTVTFLPGESEKTVTVRTGGYADDCLSGGKYNTGEMAFVLNFHALKNAVFWDEVSEVGKTAAGVAVALTDSDCAGMQVLCRDESFTIYTPSKDGCTSFQNIGTYDDLGDAYYRFAGQWDRSYPLNVEDETVRSDFENLDRLIATGAMMEDTNRSWTVKDATAYSSYNDGVQLRELLIETTVKWTDGSTPGEVNDTILWRDEVEYQTEYSIGYDSDYMFDLHINDMKSLLSNLISHSNDGGNSTFRLQGSFGFRILQYLCMHDVIDPEAIRFAIDTQLLDVTERAPSLIVQVPEGASFVPGEVVPMVLHFSEPVQLPRNFFLRINGQVCPVLDFSPCTAEDEAEVLHTSQTDFTVAYTVREEDAANGLALDPSASTLNGLTNTFGSYLDSDFDPATDDAAAVITAAVENSGIFIDLTGLEDQVFLEGFRLSSTSGQSTSQESPILNMASDETAIQIEAVIQEAYLSSVIDRETALGDTERHLYASIDGGQTFSDRFTIADGGSTLTGTLRISPNLTAEDLSGCIEFYYGKTPETAQLIYGFVGLFMQNAAAFLPESALELTETGFPAAEQQPISLDYEEQMTVSARITGTDNYTWRDLSDRENFIWAVEYLTEDGTWAEDTQSRVATLRVRDNNASCAVYPSGSGSFRVRLTVRNGGIPGMSFVKYSAAVSISGSTAPILRIAKPLQCKTILRGDNVTLNWTSNLTDLAREQGSDEVVYTIRIFRKQDNDYSPVLLDGYYAMPGDLTEWEQVGEEITQTASYASPLTAYGIPASRFTQVSPTGKYSYAVSLTGAFFKKGKGEVSKTAWAFVSVKERPAVVTLRDLPAQPVFQGEDSFTLQWTVDNYDDSNGCDFIVKVAGQVIDPAEYTFESSTPGIYNGSYTLRPADWVSDDALKENVSVELSARNAADSTWSYDSVVFTWYSESAFEIYVNGAPMDAWTLDNTGLYADLGPEELLEATKHRDIFLTAQIGMNPNVNWGSVTDRVTWNNLRTVTDEDGHPSTISGDDVATVNIRQGTAWVNIRNYPAESYSPGTSFAVSGHAKGTTTVTANHYTASQLHDELELNVTTLTGKLFLFQCYADASGKQAVELSYTNGDGELKTAVTDASGFAAVYEPSGIASDVFCVMKTADDDFYAGTFDNAILSSGERDWTEQELYPLNTLTLNRISQADFYIKDENGDVYANKPLWIHAGVYKNDVYLENALFRVSMDGSSATYSGKDGFPAVTDDSGKISMFINTAQLMLPGESVGGMRASDRVKILFELEEGDGAQQQFHYVPLLLETDASLSESDAVMFGEKIINMRPLDAGNGKHPVIAEQSVIGTEDATGDEFTLDLLDYRGNIGPGVAYSNLKLYTTVLWWGDNRAASGNNEVTFTTATGKPISLSRTEVEMPFMDDTVTRLTTNVDYELLVTDLGLVSGERTGVKVSYTPRYGNLESSSKLLPFKLINMYDIAIGDYEGEIDTILARLNQTSLPGEGGHTSTQILGGALTIVDILGEVLQYFPLCSIYLTASPDPTAFRGVISTQYGNYDEQLHPGLVTGSSYFDFLKYLNNNEKTREQWANDYGKAQDNLSDFWKQKKSDVVKGKTRKGIDFGGYMIVEMYYEDGYWVVQLIQGGLHIGGYIERMWRKNFWLGPIPCTVEIALGANGIVSYDAALDHVEDTNYHLLSAIINGYFRFFGGVGFDYDLLALKVGLFANLTLFYNLKCLWTQAPDGTDFDWGNRLGLNGEVGVRARAQFLFFAANYSYTFWDYNFFCTDFGTNYKEVEAFWEKVKDGRSTAGGYLPTVRASSGTASFDPETGLVTYASDAELRIENREYLDDFQRSWAPAAKTFRSRRRAAFTWNTLQENAYPAASPLLSDDGTLLLYLSDQNDAAHVEMTRLYVSEALDGAFPEGASLTGPDLVSADGYTGNNGYGDSQPALAGSGTSALAAWVRCAQDPALLPGETAETETIAAAMNETEIFAALYDGSNWMTTRLTENGSPDLAPATAITVDEDGNTTAVVAWRSVLASNAENPTRFDGQDQIHYRLYTTDAGWGEERVLYNGTAGMVSGMDAAILPDGTVGVCYCVDTNDRPVGAAAESARPTGGEFVPDASGREIILTIVDPFESAEQSLDDNAPALHSIRMTTDAVQDENPKLIAVAIDGEPHFVAGWLRVPDAEDSSESTSEGVAVEETPDVYLTAVAKDGTVRSDLPRNLGAMTKQMGLLMSSNFDFAAGAQTLEDLSVVWSESAAPEEEGIAQTDRLMAVKFVKYTDGTYGLTLPVTDGTAARLPGDTTIDSFRAIATESGLRAVALTTEYQDEMEPILDENGDPVTITVTGTDEDGNEITETLPLAFPKEKSVLYTAAASYQDSLMVEDVTFSRDEVFSGSTIPVQLSVTNAGTRPVTRMELVAANGEVSGIWENEKVPMEPGENLRIDALAAVPDPITDVEFRVLATLSDGVQIESDALKLEFARPDAGVSSVKITDAHDGLREIQVNGYNYSSVPVSEDAVVKVGLFSNTDGTSPIEGQELQLSADEISALNEGGYSAHFTLDMAAYVKEYYEENRGGEVPEDGILISARIWIETEDDSESGEPIMLTDAYPDNDVDWTVCPSLLDERMEELSTLAMTKQTGEDGSAVFTLVLQNNSIVRETDDVLYLRLLDADGSPILDANGREIAAAPEGTAETGCLGIEERAELTYLFEQSEAASAVTAEIVTAHRVHFDPGEGKGEMEDLILPWQGTTTLPANAFTREHNSFLHWSTEPDGSGEIYADMAEITDAGSDITLYAQWERQAFTVRWFSVTELLESDQSVPYGSAAQYDGEPPIHAPDAENHFSFYGWSDGNSVYTPSDKLPEVTGDLTFSAEFSSEPHIFRDEITKEPKCTEEGTRTYTCTVCGYSYTEQIPAPGHSYQLQITAPTCTAQGYTTYTCSKCGDRYVDDEVAALGHDYGEWTVTKEAACTADGEQTRSCSRCDAKETQKIPALKHEFRDGVCTRCGEADPDYVPPVDKGELDKAITAAGMYDENDYTPETYGALKDALDAAKAVQADEAADQAAVDAAAKAVNDAIVALEPTADKADKRELAKAIAAAEDVDPEKYTDETVEALNKALEAAKDANGKDDATQDEVDAAAKALNDALEDLEKVPPFRFDDVRDESKFYFNPVYWAYEHKPQITNGMDEIHFEPNNACTRGQVVTFLWRAAGCPKPKSATTPFTDLKPGAFYEKAVAWAVEEGITKGMTDTTFAPDATCNRGQIVTFLWRFAGEEAPKSTKTDFTDLMPGAFYEKAVAWAVENEVTNGMTATTFVPDGTCTRGQVVTFLYRATA